MPEEIVINFINFIQEDIMNSKISLLDCTLRDGAYVVNAKFGSSAIKGIVNKLQDASVDIIECGWLKNSPHEKGTSFFHVPDDFGRYLKNKDTKLTYAVMIDWDRYDLDTLPVYDGKTIDAIRVVFPHGKHREGVEVGRKIKEKGYQVFFQAANTLAYSDEDLIDLANTVNSVDPVSLSVVDTFGAMFDEDLERIVKVLHKHLNPEIKLGFHSHNNQQLSFALTMHFIEMLPKLGRDGIVDASLCGMGRGAGNATTELVVSYLNKKCDTHYDMDAIMDAIDIYMEYFKENYEWGYSTPYFIAGLYCCHVNNIAYLLNNHRTTAKDMRNIIESLDPEDRKKYDYDLLEQKYLQNCNHDIDDSETLAKLVDAVAGREVLLVAPGKSAVLEKKRIDEYVADKSPVVIGVNAMLPDYDYDFVFFANPARYEYAQKNNPEEFAKTSRILLSNIKAEADAGESVIALNTVVKRGWVHFDNGMICALRLLDRMGITKVSIAGFDGFKSRYNQSYADPFLPSLKTDSSWNQLNREIQSMFDDVKASAKNLKSFRFITSSYFDGEDE